MGDISLIDDDISRYIEIYEETYGEVLSRGVAEIHLEVLAEFAREILLESARLREKNEDENGRLQERLE